MNEEENEPVFRQYEAELDEYYKSLDFWKIPRDIALYALLAEPDAMHLAFMMGMQQLKLTSGQAQLMKSTIEGFSQAMAWLCKDLDEIVFTPTTDDSIINEAGLFAMYASDYVNVADFHKMYGRKQVAIEVDSTSQTVTFKHIHFSGMNSFDSWHEGVQEENRYGQKLISKLKQIPPETLRNILVDVKYKLNSGHIHILHLPKDLVTRLGAMATIQFDCEPFSLPDNSDLIGFSMEEYKAFYSAVASWSFIAFFTYMRLAISGTPQRECLPTQIVNRSEFIEQICFLTGLPAKKVDCILQRLTYDPRSNCDIMTRPFICNSQYVAWSPAIINQYRAERNMLKIMARGKKVLKRQSDNLIGQRELPFGKVVGKHFAQYGYQYKLHQKIVADNMEGEIDVTLYQTKRPEEVLLIETKAILRPDEINEVQHATNELQHGQDQLRIAMKILKKMSPQEKRAVFKFIDWSKVRSFYPIVVSCDTEPNMLLKHDEIPAIAFTTLKNRIHNRDIKTPQRVWQSCRDRSWLQEEIESEEVEYKPIKIGHITYRLPMRKVKYQNIEWNGPSFPRMT